MKVSELKDILEKCPDEAEIILCHELATDETGVEWIELENNGFEEKIKLHEVPKYDLYSCRNAKEIKPY